MLETEVCHKKIRGLNTSWLQAGSADSKSILLFLHGFPDGPEAFAKLQSSFASEYLTIAPFVRGCGESEPSKDLNRYRIDSLCLDILGILKSVDPESLKKIAIVAHDLGVPLAWRLRQSLGKRLAAAVMINGLSLGQMLRRWNRPAQHVRSWYIYALQIPVLSGLLFNQFPTSIRRWMLRQGGFQEDLRLSDEDNRRRLVDPSQQYRAFVLDALSEVKFSAAKRVGAPILVLWAKNDSFLLPPNLDELEFDADRVEVRIVDGDHWFFRERANDVEKIVANFIEQNAVLA